MRVLEVAEALSMMPGAPATLMVGDRTTHHRSDNPGKSVRASRDTIQMDSDRPVDESLKFTHGDVASMTSAGTRPL
jgi:hypothetical protein